MAFVAVGASGPWTWTAPLPNCPHPVSMAACSAHLCVLTCRLPPPQLLGWNVALAGRQADTWPVTQRHVTSSPQIQKWGNIEWAHDYELRELRARTAAGTLFVHLCSESATVKHKLLQQ